MRGDFVAGDTNATLEARLKKASDGSAFDLTGCTVLLRWKIGTAGSVVEKAMTVAAPTTGVATYRFGEDELAEGDLYCEVQVTETSTSRILTTQVLGLFTVRAALS